MESLSLLLVFGLAPFSGLVTIILLLQHDGLVKRAYETPLSKKWRRIAWIGLILSVICWGSIIFNSLSTVGEFFHVTENILEGIVIDLAFLFMGLESFAYITAAYLEHKEMQTTLSAEGKTGLPGWIVAFVLIVVLIIAGLVFVRYTA